MRRIRSLELMANAVRATYIALTWQPGGGFMWQTKWTTWATNSPLDRRLRPQGAGPAARRLPEGHRRGQARHDAEHLRLSLDATAGSPGTSVEWTGDRQSQPRADQADRPRRRLRGDGRVDVRPGGGQPGPRRQPLDRGDRRQRLWPVGQPRGIRPPAPATASSSRPASSTATRCRSPSAPPRRSGPATCSTRWQRWATPRATRGAGGRHRPAGALSAGGPHAALLSAGAQVYDNLTAHTPTPPWMLRPAVMRDMSYRPAARSEPGSFLDDPRDIYVEEVEVTPSGAVSLRTSLFDKSDLLANQLDYLEPWTPRWRRR